MTDLLYPKGSNFSGKFDNAMVIGIGLVSLDSIDYIFCREMAYTEFLVCGAGRTSVPTFHLSKTASLSKWTHLTTGLETRQPKVAFLIASAETISLNQLKTFSADLRNKGVYVIALVIVPDGVLVSNTYERISAISASLHSAVDGIILIPGNSGEKIGETEQNGAIYQVINSLNAFILNTSPSSVNVDFVDVKTVLSKGLAFAGVAVAEGPNRASECVHSAFSARFLPLALAGNAHQVLLSIQSGSEAELELEELTLITELIQEKAGEKADIIFGHAFEAGLGSSIKLSVIISFSTG